MKTETNITETTFKERCKTAKPKRAWSGKIKNIDEFIAYLYDQDILTQTEKNKKDIVFRAYYRYYNDGDYPAALRSKDYGFTGIENGLETYLDDYIKLILTKYLPKVNRQDFYKKLKIQKLKTLIGVIEYNGNIDYWIKETNYTPNIYFIDHLEHIERLEKRYKKQALVYLDEATINNLTIFGIKSKLAEKNLGIDLFDNIEDDIKETSAKLAEIVYTDLGKACYTYNRL